MLPDQTIIILDFDGVILESVRAKDLAFREVFSEYGPRIQDQAMKYHLDHPGLPRRQKLACIFKDIIGHEADEEELDGYYERLSAAVIEQLNKAELVPGIDSFLTSITTPVYVASAAPEDEVKVAIERRNLAQFFRGILGGPRAKQKSLEEILASTGLKPSQALYIGDKLSDYNAARTIGIPFVGRTSSEGNPFPSKTPVIRDFTTKLPEIH